MNFRQIFNTVKIQVGVGLSLVAAGVILIFIGARSSEPSQSDGVKTILAVSHHLGTAILTSGILVITVETAIKIREQRDRLALEKEHNKYIESVRSASNESLLRTLMPDPAIFDQVLLQIINQRFVRKNLVADVTLKWTDSRKDAVARSSDISYEIVNMASNKGSTPINIRSAPDLPSDPPSVLDHVTLRSKTRLHLTTTDGTGVEIDAGTIKTFKYDELLSKKMLTITGNQFHASWTLDLEAQQQAEVNFYMTSTERVKDDDCILCLLPTVGLRVDVHHEIDMEVTHRFFHPTDILRRDQEDKKSWAVEVGLLPYQGIEYSWEKKQS